MENKKNKADNNVEFVVNAVEENCELTEVEIEGVAGGGISLAGLQAY